MDLRLFEYFIAVADEENITKAAHRLHITQPTLSRQLHDLEKEMGKQLLIRTTRKTILTKDGQLFLTRAQEILNLYDKTRAELNSEKKDIRGQLSIGAGETYQVKKITDIMKKMHDEHPHLTFRIYSGVADDVLKKVDEGLLDFALLFGPYDHESYERIVLPDTDQMGILMPDDHPLADQEALSIDDLKTLPLLVSTRSNSNNHPLVKSMMNSSDFHIVGTFNLVYNACLMAQSGLGCVLTIDRILPRMDHFRFVPIVPTIETHLSIAWKKYRHLSDADSLFIEMLKDSVKQS